MKQLAVVIACQRKSVIMVGRCYNEGKKIGRDLIF